MSLVVMSRKYRCTRNGGRCDNVKQKNFKGNENVMMKRKQQAISGSRPTIKKNIYRNKHCGGTSKTINKSINYHSYYNKKRQKCGCDKSITVKSRVQERKHSSLHILEKKLKVLQRINCKLKETNGKKPIKTIENKNCVVVDKYTTEERKKNKYRYCNTTQDLRLNTSYNERYANLIADKSYNCVDEQNSAKIKDSAHCGVY